MSMRFNIQMGHTKIAYEKFGPFNYKFSRENVYRADELGLRMVQQAGFDSK